ncbi:RadC family protein [Jeotgalibaca porci]|uniref:RadC family protein n=1 Tax=Jeotgalibaca porci TaxID=1868793 RepID=UPI003F8FF5A5
MQATSLLKEVPKSSRPRERLAQYGEKSLATHELLAILLRTGPKDSNVLQLAMRVMNEFEDLHSLKMASLEELMTINGIGEAKAIEIKACIELGLRLAHSTQLKSGVITSTKTAGALLMQEMRDLQQEHVIALYLNTKNEIIKKKTIFIGSLNSSVAHPREIFREAVRFSAARIILGHNHPSGNPDPSEADLVFTRRMVECGEMMGIELLDHFIIGDQIYISLKEYGII